MHSTLRFFILPLVASAALWCSTSLASHDLIDQDASELNLADGASDGWIFSYWNSYFCALEPWQPFCASAQPCPYIGPAWYNWKFGFDDWDGGRARHGREHRGHRGRGR